MARTEIVHRYIDADIAQALENRDRVIEWGVYGLPETFVIDAEGRIRYKHIGQMPAPS